MNIRKFSKAIGVTTRSIRRWESLQDRIMPQRATELMNKIKLLFIEKGLFGNVSLSLVLRNFHEWFSPFGPGENKVITHLKKAKIQFDVHVNFPWRRNKLNVDFVIPSLSKPKITIEVTRITAKKWKDIVTHIDVLDHRSQLLKLANKKLKTIIFIQCTRENRKRVISAIEKEIVNTDFVIVNDVDKLIEIIKELK